MVDRRVDGIPLEQVLGWAELSGLRIEVDPGVFVPRPRSELLVGQAIEVARRGAVVVDLCCGSGAIGRAVAAAVDRAELHASDVDPAAVECARRNLAGIGQVYEGDLYEPLPAELYGRVDVLVANVPYVPTGEIDLLPREARLYEPKVALDGGVDGLEVQRRVTAAAPSWLASGGHLLIEASEHQTPRVVEDFAANGLIPRIAGSRELSATVVVGAKPADVDRC